jgi:hypothetical protein
MYKQTYQELAAIAYGLMGECMPEHLAIAYAERQLANSHPADQIAEARKMVEAKVASWNTYH